MLAISLLTLAIVGSVHGVESAIFHQIIHYSSPARSQSPNTRSTNHSSTVLIDFDNVSYDIQLIDKITYSPERLPLGFLKIAKGDESEGWRRYHDTLAWRRSERIDEILNEKHEHFHIIKTYYPHYFHLRGRNNEPVYYEKPAKINIGAMKRQGITMDVLLRHYALVTEYMWRCLDPTEEGRSIYIIDLDGFRLRDFVGDVITFVRKATDFTSKHYPERSGHIFLLNAPVWFNHIWRIVKPMVDPEAIGRISILREKDEIFRALNTFIPSEHIPPDYGGVSMPLGHAPEEKLLTALIRRNNMRVF